MQFAVLDPRSRGQHILQHTKHGQPRGAILAGARAGVDAGLEAVAHAVQVRVLGQAAFERMAQAIARTKATQAARHRAHGAQRTVEMGHGAGQAAGQGWRLGRRGAVMQRREVGTQCQQAPAQLALQFARDPRAFAVAHIFVLAHQAVHDIVVVGQCLLGLRARLTFGRQLTVQGLGPFFQAHAAAQAQARQYQRRQRHQDAGQQLRRGAA